MSGGFTINQASRVGVKALIGLYGKSGGGKTRSALMLARGIVGPKGKIRLIDTENRRGHIFADKIPGGYEVLDFDAPFTPERYVEAFELAEAGADIVVTDSMSHEWDGESGVLQLQEAELTRMAGDDYKRREACKMAAWIKPKMSHKKFVQRVLRSKCPVICCLRGQEKTHIVKDDNKKTQVITDDWSSPIYDPRFIFEMLISAEVYSVNGVGGFLHITKITHEDLFGCLPKDGEQVSAKHGELLAQWCASPGKPASAPAAAPDGLKVQKGALWKSLKSVRGADQSWAVAEEWLWNNGLLASGTLVNGLSEEEITKLIASVEAKLKTPVPA